MYMEYFSVPAAARLVISNDDDVRKNTKLPVIQDGSDRASRISVVYKHCSDPSCCHNFLALGQAAAPPTSLVPDRKPLPEAYSSMADTLYGMRARPILALGAAISAARTAACQGLRDSACRAEWLRCLAKPEPFRADAAVPLYSSPGQCVMTTRQSGDETPRL